MKITFLQSACMLIESDNTKILSAPCIVSVEPTIAHLLTALEDSLFLECFDVEYSAIDYLPYRNIVDEKIK